MKWHLKGLWDNGDFVKLWVGQTISNFGSGITGIALPLTAVLVLAATPTQMGILGALDGAAVFVFGLVAGVWVDRLRRRPILIIADIGRAVLLGSIPLAALLGILHLGQLYIVAGLTGILTVFFNVAYESFLPSLIPTEQLVEANSKLGMSDALAEIGGPGSAGALVQLLGAPLTIGFDALSFLLSALSIGLVRTREPKPGAMQGNDSNQVGSYSSATGGHKGPTHNPPDCVPTSTSVPTRGALAGAEERRRNIWRESSEGLRMIRESRLLRPLVISAALFNFFGSFIGTLYVLYIVRDIHAPPLLIGFLIATGGVSALAGTLVAQRVIRRLGVGMAIGGMLFLYGLTGLLIPLAQGSLIVAATLLFASQLIGDVSVAIYLIAEVSFRQALIPNALLGRVNASIQFLTQGVGPVAAILAGILGSVIGLRLTILIGVLGVICAGAWLLFSPIRKVRSLTLET
jgi:MFS family permease